MRYVENLYDVSKNFDVRKNFGPLKWYTDRNFFGDGGEGGGRSSKLSCSGKKIFGTGRA